MTRRQPQPLVLDTDGPPAVQTMAHVEQRPVPGRPGEQTVVVHDQRIHQTQWRDPEDTSVQARHHGARNIAGWRREDSLVKLHDTCPREITTSHLAAGNRYRRDHELGVLGVRLGQAVNTPVSGGASHDLPAAQLDALGRFREATAAVGPPGSQAVTVLCRVVLDNWTLSDLKAVFGVSRDRMHGRFYASIERLREHYLSLSPTREARDGGYAPSGADQGENAPAERMGRWRATGGAA